jgi:hypothetical protein
VTIGMMEYLIAALVIIIGVYAYLTYRVAKASEASLAAIREQFDAMSPPHITVVPFIRPHTPFLCLRIQNTGRAGAENVRLSIDRDFYQYGETRNLRTLNAFTAPIDSLEPGGQLIFTLAQVWMIFGENARPDATPPRFNVTAAYEFRGNKVEQVHRIDLRPYLWSAGEHDPVVEELERIRQVMEKSK